MEAIDSPGLVGRRDRNMQDKHVRIFRAAAELFDARGFAAVTTQAISDRADVAAGTLFRYAASKDELLLMVYNQRLRAALKQGERVAADLTAPVAAVLAMVLPILKLGHQYPENLAVYQRQLMFGQPGEKYRVEGLALINELETCVAEKLLQFAAARGQVLAPAAARLASISIFAATHLAVSRVSTGAHPGYDAEDDLRGQIQQIVDGCLLAVAAS